MSEENKEINEISADEETVSKENASEEAVIEEIVSEENVSGETVDEEAASDENVSEEAVSNETSSAEPVIEETVSTNKIIGKSLSDLSPVRVVRYLLIFLTLLLCVGIWFRMKPANAPSNKPQETEDSAEVTPEPTPLPNELIDPASVTVLVNKTHSLPADYVPANLVTPYVLSISDVIQVSDLAADQLKAMVNAANESEVTLYLTSGYISYETQDDYFNDRAGMVGEAEANKVIAKAGYSEHQTGLAFDFSDNASGTATTTAFAETAAGKWLIEHAWEYGFVMRYPEGKEAVTGYSYQPWHFRYLGIEVAKAMHEIAPDLTMEEYYNVN